MAYHITIIEPGSTEETWTRETLTKRPDLDYMQKAVGGPIQEVPHWDTFGGEHAWVLTNEEGKLHGFLPNPSATKLWAEVLGGTTREQLVRFDRETEITITVLDGPNLRPDFLVGPVLIIKADTEKELEAL